MTKQEAIKLVEKYLAKHPPKGYRLHVVPGASRHEDGSWYISVRPDRENIRRYDYYDILAQVEREIEDEERVNILLVPAAAASKTAAPKRAGRVRG